MLNRGMRNLFVLNVQSIIKISKFNRKRSKVSLYIQKHLRDLILFIDSIEIPELVGFLQFE
jgi:hypothetical protein